jgi:predicted alpha/beta-hydrolase family hydrolase
MRREEFPLKVGGRTDSVSAILLEPEQASAIYVFAHGAGANLRHRFMEAVAVRLADAGIATLRYNFPYMEQGGRRPDPPMLLEATVAAAIERATAIAGNRTLLAGGKSMGGRMTSGLLSRQPNARVQGLVFVGFPLHPPGKPGMARADHLAAVQQPMLFLQGTRDTLADIDLVRQVCAGLGERATLHIVAGGDHSFAVLKRSGRSMEEVYHELITTIVEWAAPL